LKYSAPLFGGALCADAIRAPIFPLIVLGSDHRFDHQQETLEMTHPYFPILRFPVGK
jgi:anaerobic glycerol-3-phosphate dehydrogenase